MDDARFRPHPAPTYTGHVRTPSASPAATLRNPASGGRRKDSSSTTRSTSRQLSGDNKYPLTTEANTASNTEGNTTTFVEPDKNLSRNVSRTREYPTVAQQSGLSRQISLSRQLSLSRHLSSGSYASYGEENRPPSPAFPHAALALSRSVSAPGATYIDWEQGDPECPFYWPKRKKWLTTLACCFYASITGILTVAYNATGPQVEAEFGVSQTVFYLGNTTYLVAIAMSPLVLAPFSELIGRKYIFQASALMTALMMIPQATAKNIYAILFSRLVMGIAASSGNSLVAGIIADMFVSHERSLPTSMFALTIFVSQGFGPLCASYSVAAQGWRTTFWWQMAIAFGPFILLMIFLDETRGPVLLSKRAARMTAECEGRTVYRCRADDERTTVAQMVMTSISRPVIYLTTEPVVISFALWIATIWATAFLSIAAIPIAFKYAYNWTAQQSSLLLLTLSVGGVLGFILNLWQDRLYQRAVIKYNGNPPPEIRLYSCCIGAFLVPIGLLTYAWGAQSHVHPVVPIIGLATFATGAYPIYLGVFVVLSSLYGRYASSAMAAQSWLRNILSSVAPLYTPAMYNNLTPPIATTILASITAVLGVCPFVLIFFGPQIRAKSRVAKAMEREEEELAETIRLEQEKEERRQRRKEQKEKWLNDMENRQPPEHDLSRDPEKGGSDVVRELEETAVRMEST
ncbi:unnamed protein product [Sympodiomycopsis kandeliae]